MSRAGKGTTLIEVMIAALIFSIVVIGGFALFTSGRSQIALRKHHRVAAQLAAQRLEELKAGSYNDILVGKTEEAISLEDFSYSRTIATEDVGLYKKVEVTVHWDEMSKQRPVTLVTFIAPK